jgi:hypothetical protein
VDEQHRSVPKPRDMARLLELGTDVPDPTVPSDPAVTDQEKGHALQDLLGTTMPVDVAVSQSLPAVLVRVCNSLQSLTREKFGQLLQKPSNDLATVEQIKEYAKRLSKSVPAGPEQEASTVVYYAAIANALVFHDKRITGRSLEKLKQAFDRLAGLPWVEQGLVQLLRKASEICGTKMQERRE